MTYPTAAVVTTNLDAGTDSPATARSDILDAVQKLNQIIAHTTTFAATLLDDTTAAAARTTLGAAASGANTDITSLGAVTGVTASVGDDDTTMATTAFVQAEIVNKAVTLTGNQTVVGVKTFSSQPILPQATTLATAVATTSGTSIDFTGIPSWAKKITVLFIGVSTSGTSVPLVRLGTSGGVQTTGYLSGSFGASAGAVVGWASSLVGFNLQSSTGAVDTLHGALVIAVQSTSSNTWAASGSVNNSGGSAYITAGSVALGGTLDRIRLTTTNGTDTFDAGSVNIIYEG